MSLGKDFALTLGALRSNASVAGRGRRVSPHRWLTGRRDKMCFEEIIVVAAGYTPIVYWAKSPSGSDSR